MGEALLAPARSDRPRPPTGTGTPSSIDATSRSQLSGSRRATQPRLYGWVSSVWVARASTRVDLDHRPATGERDETVRSVASLDREQRPPASTRSTAQTSTSGVA